MILKGGATGDSFRNSDDSISPEVLKICLHVGICVVKFEKPKISEYMKRNFENQGYSLDHW